MAVGCARQNRAVTLGKGRPFVHDSCMIPARIGIPWHAAGTVKG
jgi:hypothetical protein